MCAETMFYGGRPTEKQFMNFIELKIKMLKRDFKIKLTDAEIAHFYELKTVDEVNRFVHDIIMKKL